MNALSRLLPTIERHGKQQLCTSRIVHEIASTYDEALREYRENAARRAREDWLLQECSLLVKRINIIRAKLLFHIEESLSPALLNRHLRANQRQLDAHREELRKLRSET